MAAIPENGPGLWPDNARKPGETGLHDTVIGRLQELAKGCEIALLVGSFAESPATPDPRGHNTSVLIDPTGASIAVYRKMHLFDVETPSGQVLRESDGIAAGNDVVVAPLGAWTLGLSICYDLRFPEFYRCLVDKGAQLLCVPSAFTAETGRDHWELLLRARAVENLSYVIAPNQWGVHFKGRRSYGRSMIIDPWGSVVAQIPDTEGVCVADIDLDRVEELRASFPCLQHRKL